MMKQTKWQAFLDTEMAANAFIEERDKILKQRENQRILGMHILIANYNKYNNPKNIKITKTI